MNRPRTKIRPPKRGLAVDHVDWDETWSILAQSLEAIHKQNASKLSFEELYRNAYKLVLKKMGDKLYNSVLELIEKHLKEVALNDVVPTRPNSVVAGSAAFGAGAELEKRDGGNRFLAAVRKAWENHQLCVRMINDVLMYMDRSYCADKEIPSVYTAAMGVFRDELLLNPAYETLSTLTSVVLDQIRMERDGDIIDRGPIRACVSMLDALYENDKEQPSDKLYLTRFESEFLKDSNDYYEKEGQRLLQECDAATYVHKTNKRLQEESHRVQFTLTPQKEQTILQVVEKRLIENNIKEVLMMENGLRKMLDSDNYADLSAVYALVKRVDKSLLVIKAIVSGRIIEMGKELTNNLGICPNMSAEAGAEGGTGEGSAKQVQDEKALTNATTLAIDWVDKVLALKDKYDQILKRGMAQDEVMHRCFTQAFADFINEFQRSPEYISLFIDDNLKRGLKGKTEQEVDATLDKAIVLFRYVRDKDIFEKYYKTHLARRLLTGKSVSMDAERQMISKMKLEVGYAFTGKMENMFKDIGLSDDLTQEYREFRLNSPIESRKPEFSVQVLTSNVWPLQSLKYDENHEPCTLPDEIQVLAESFRRFYTKKHTGRKLTFQASGGNADLRATFKARTHDLNVPTYAMIVLLAFNDLSAEHPYLTYDQLHTMTRIPEGPLKRTLLSLAVAPKTRVLVKTPMSKDIKPDDKFSFNGNFTSKMTRIRIGMVQANKVESEKELKETTEKVEETRQHQIEAAIVRIMKQRKVAPHNELVMEVVDQLSSRFKPDLTVIKKRIESLMDREYLERLPNARTTYKYLA